MAGTRQRLGAQLCSRIQVGPPTLTIKSFQHPDMIVLQQALRSSGKDELLPTPVRDPTNYSCAQRLTLLRHGA